MLGKKGWNVLDRRIPIVVGCLAIILALGQFRAYGSDRNGAYSFNMDMAKAGEALGVVERHPLGAADAICSRNGHFYTVGEDLKPNTADDRLVRFWGVNITPPLTFPRTEQEARDLATALAAMGFNLVRIHAVDARSGKAYKSLLDGDGPYPSFSEENLVALDRLVSALASYGIYIDLPLKVAASYAPEDCLGSSCVPDPSVSVGRYETPHPFRFGCKPLDLFNRQMIDLQKQYARMILERYGQSPSLAMIEINNENSLIEVCGLQGKDIPPAYARELDVLWNDWLLEKYGNSSALRAAWERADGVADGASSSGFSQPGSGGVLRGWELLQSPSGSRWGSVKMAQEGVVELRLDTLPNKYWHFMLVKGGVPITKGQAYEVRFKAHADKPRKIGVAIQGMSSEAQSLAPSRYEAEVGTTAREYGFRFVATQGDANGRLAILPLLSGGDIGTVWVADWSFRPVSAVGLPEGETLEEKSVTRPQPGKAAAARALAVMEDYLLFLADTERRYYEEMLALIKDELGVRVPVTGTQANYGGLLAHKNMAELMDFMDIHYYYDHPSIPKDDQDNWTMSGKPMVDNPDLSILTAVASARVFGRPMVISEYGPNQTNPFAQEWPLVASACGAFQDVDGIIVFDLFTTGGDARDRLPVNQLLGWYNVLGDARTMAQMIAASRIFRNGTVHPAGGMASVVVEDGMGLEQAVEGTSIRDIGAFFKGKGLAVAKGMETRIGAVYPGIAFEQAESPVPAEAKELAWSAGKAKSASHLLIDAEYAKGVVGYLPETALFSGGHFATLGGQGAFGAVSMVGLDGKPVEDSRDILITVVGDGSNEFAEVFPVEGGVRLAVKGALGKESPFWSKEAGAFKLAPFPVVIFLDRDSDDVVVHVLDPQGRSKGTVDVQRVPSGVSFVVGTGQQQSPWYRVRLDVSDNGQAIQETE